MSSYAEGQTHQLANALEAAGYTAAHITKLGQFSGLGELKAVLDGHAEIKRLCHVVDCDANPFVSDGWKVEEHKKGGQVTIEHRGDDLFVNDCKIELYLHKGQQNGKGISGYVLRDALKREVLNACILHYLLAHPDLIPDSWKKNTDHKVRVYFWGTIYRCSDSHSLSVPYLGWSAASCGWSFGQDCLSNDYRGNDLALVLASEN